ncbi:MAG TPA: macro domain-containing protein [Chloroflexia bacterium]|nr:macro domain-containing protein [Chloroflexia bacterium]
MLNQIQIARTFIELQTGNIVNAATEAIVNAANSRLSGGGGVDGAIHRAAGKELYELTKPLGRCPTGSAVITGAGRLPLPTLYIIHAVGPFYNPLKQEESARLLAGAYRSSLILADQHNLKSIAFPSISTGAYRYPIRQAARVALQTVIDYLKSTESSLELVRFILFSPKDLQAYQETLLTLHNEE